MEGQDGGVSTVRIPHTLCARAQRVADTFTAHRGVAVDAATLQASPAHILTRGASNEDFALKGKGMKGG